MPHFTGNIRQFMRFMGDAKSPFEKFEKVQSIKAMNEMSRKKNRDRLKANIHPGPLKK